MAHLEASRLKKIVYKKGDLEIQLEKEDAPVRAISAEPSAPHPVEHPPTKTTKREEVKGNFVISPLVGTYYASPAPDQPPFVKVGDRVSEETIVCIIEAMKVMNEVKAGVSGVVSEVLVDNAHPVEFGTRLLRIT